MPRIAGPDITGDMAKINPLDPHGPRPQRRIKPFLGGTVAPDVDAAVRAEAARSRLPVSHAFEAVLRRGLGLAPAPSPSST